MKAAATQRKEVSALKNRQDMLARKKEKAKEQETAQAEEAERLQQVKDEEEEERLEAIEAEKQIMRGAKKNISALHGGEGRAPACAILSSGTDQSRWTRNRGHRVASRPPCCRRLRCLCLTHPLPPPPSHCRERHQKGRAIHTSARRRGAVGSGGCVGRACSCRNPGVRIVRARRRASHSVGCSPFQPQNQFDSDQSILL